MTRNRADRRGFTLIEVLAGMLFMAIVIPVTIEGISLAHRVGIVSERRREAIRLGQQVLDEVVATESWRNGGQNQEFGEDWPGYSWNLSTTNWSEDGMTEVTVEVTFKVLGREYRDSISTLAQTADNTSSSGTSSGSGSTGSTGSSGTSGGSGRNTSS